MQHFISNCISGDISHRKIETIESHAFITGITLQEQMQLREITKFLKPMKRKKLNLVKLGMCTVLANDNSTQSNTYFSAMYLKLDKHHRGYINISDIEWLLKATGEAKANVKGFV